MGSQLIKVGRPAGGEVSPRTAAPGETARTQRGHSPLTAHRRHWAPRPAILRRVTTMCALALSAPTKQTPQPALCWVKEDTVMDWSYCGMTQVSVGLAVNDGYQSRILMEKEYCSGICFTIWICLGFLYTEPNCDAVANVLYLGQYVYWLMSNEFTGFTVNFRKCWEGHRHAHRLWVWIINTPSAVRQTADSTDNMTYRPHCQQGSANEEKWKYQYALR